MAAALALEASGYEVEIYEALPWLGGRAGSFPLDRSGAAEQQIDNCQHILLGCCTALQDFYRRLGVSELIRFYDEYYFLEPGGRLSRLAAGPLPGRARFLSGLWGLHFLGVKERLAILAALRRIPAELERRRDLDAISMLDWLRAQHQPPQLLGRFWRQILVSALNEELDRMSAWHGLRVFALAFLAGRDGYRLGVPAAPLGELYAERRWRRFPRVRILLRSPVRRLRIEQGRVRAAITRAGEAEADVYVSATPLDRVGELAPELDLDVSRFESSPITGIHLWFDRPVMELPHATLLDRTIQWVFNKSEGRYLVVVVSASRSLLAMPREQVTALTLKELGEFLPRVREARLEQARVIKQVRATFSPLPGSEALRPPAATRIANLFLAGDWTRTGWPATMESAVRSGYQAAAAITGRPATGLSIPYNATDGRPATDAMVRRPGRQQ